MKTPREILLSQHSQKQKTLDAVRAKVIGEIKLPAESVKGTKELPAWSKSLWDLRWHLVPLAALWLLVIGLQLSSSSGGQPARADVTVAKRNQMLASARENRRQLSELIEARSVEAAPKIDKALRPRTQ